jgi:hypothetical protein
MERQVNNVEFYTSQKPSGLSDPIIVVHFHWLVGWIFLAPGRLAVDGDRRWNPVGDHDDQPDTQGDGIAWSRGIRCVQIGWEYDGHPASAGQSLPENRLFYFGGLVGKPGLGDHRLPVLPDLHRFASGIMDD